MKFFATELRGKTVMTEDGQLLGILEDFLFDLKTGRIQSLLVAPAESVETRLFQTDPKGRLVLVDMLNASRQCAFLEVRLDRFGKAPGVITGAGPGTMTEFYDSMKLVEEGKVKPIIEKISLDDVIWP